MIGQVNTVGLAGISKPTCTQTYSQRKQFPGVKDLEFEGGWQSDPAKLYYWEVVIAPMSNNTPGAQFFRAEIHFTVMFSEPVLLAASGVSAGGTGIGGLASGNSGVTGAFAPGAGGDAHSSLNVT